MGKRSIKLNALYNVINQGSVILFQLITMKYISSVLHSENYGRFNFCNSILAYFLLLAQLGISSYVIREGAGVRDDKEKLWKLANEVFTINFCSTVFSIIFYIFTVLTWTRLANERFTLYILGIQLLLNIINVEWIYNIYEDFKFISLRNLCVQVISFGCMIVFVKNEGDYLKYTLIFAMAASLGYCINFFFSRKMVPIRITLHPNLKKHIRPILLLFFNSLAVLIYVNSDITILGILESDSAVGIYSVSVKIYTVVKRVFQAVVIVSVPRLSNYYINGEIEKYKLLLKRMHDVVITIVIPMLFGLIMTSKNAILIVSGKEYIGGINSLRILCLALIFSSLANYYISCVLLPSKKDNMILISTVVSSIINIGLNLIFIPILGMDGAAITTVIAEMTVMILAYEASGSYRQNKECIQVYIKVAMGGMGIFVTCWMIEIFDFSLFFDTILKIVFSVLAYMCIEIMVKNTIVIEMIEKIRKK
ncbi:MAG: flippase [Hungatella sp.]|jgi:O-antigen/teichoic acid export membrane protein|nr:flippase [Hungatella sp.]